MALLKHAAALLILGLPLAGSDPASGLVARTQPGELRAPLTASERWDLYLRDNYASTGAFFRSAWPAAINQWSNEPPEWGQGMEGYGKRLASQFAARSLQGSIEHGVAAAMRTDPRYERCQCAGFLPRLGHAVASNFVTRTSSGGRTVNVPFMAGTYGSAMASLAWYPERYSWKDGFREGSQRLLISGSFNVFREFWPEMKKVLPFTK